MIRIPKPGVWNDHLHLVYDAWNQLVEVRAADDSTVVAQYQFDGRNFRTVKKTYSGGQLSETRHFYYNGDWQVSEERVGDSTSANRQYVWGDRYVDDLILRERDINADGIFDERLHVMQDANWNVVAVADTNGDVQERYVYTAYGSPTVLTGVFGSRGSTSYAWDILYTGRQYDPETGLYYYRNRYYGAELGRFPSRDPIEYGAASANLYLYVGNAPTSNMDPSGLTLVTCHCVKAGMGGGAVGLFPVDHPFDVVVPGSWVVGKDVFQECNWACGRKGGRCIGWDKSDTHSSSGWDHDDWDEYCSKTDYRDMNSVTCWKCCFTNSAPSNIIPIGNLILGARYPKPKPLPGQSLTSTVFEKKCVRDALRITIYQARVIGRIFMATNIMEGAWDWGRIARCISICGNPM